MQPIKRAGPPRLSEVRGHTFVWTVRLSGEPSGKWLEAFKNSSEHTILRSRGKGPGSAGMAKALLPSGSIDERRTGWGA
jgi:hypothetical protein